MAESIIVEQAAIGGDFDAQSSWHAIYTRHQHERAVADVLARKGFDIFLPQYRAMRQWKDRRKQISLPLFPNYVFVEGGLSRTLDILSTPGVYGLVTFGSRPATIPEQEIGDIKRLIETDLRVEPHPFLKCGDRVRVKSGPLEGILGILVRTKSAFRLVLSVEMLQKSVTVEVDVWNVEREAGEIQPDVLPGWGQATGIDRSHDSSAIAHSTHGWS